MLFGNVCKEHWTEFSNRISGSSSAVDEFEIQNHCSMYESSNKNPEKSCVCNLISSLISVSSLISFIPFKNVAVA